MQWSSFLQITFNVTSEQRLSTCNNTPCISGPWAWCQLGLVKPGRSQILMAPSVTKHPSMVACGFQRSKWRLSSGREIQCYLRSEEGKSTIINQGAIATPGQSTLVHSSMEISKANLPRFQLWGEPSLPTELRQLERTFAKDRSLEISNVILIRKRAKIC